MTQFYDLGLAKPILRALSAEGYDTPTPIQSQVVPTMLDGRDILGTAQTGTGKTAAFVLPLLHQITQGHDRPDAKCATALILAPTRELAGQIAESVRTYGKFVNHSRAVIVGGVKPGPQIRTMARGVDFLVATPGRLLDLMASGAIHLNTTTKVVLDEADQMMDLGFLPAIHRILAKLPRDRQTILLSATMPKQIRGLANDFLQNPVEIAVAPVSRPIERIDQNVIRIDRAAKRDVLIKLMHQPEVERAIVFTRTKRGADKVNLFLQKSGLSAMAIHGNKSQGQRERALAAFRAGRLDILVATDIAARGIDVDGISHVVNFDLPNVPEAYVHRIGRTARAGKRGIAISLCDASERKQLRDIEKLIGYRLDTGPFAEQSRIPEGKQDPRGATHTPEQDGPENGEPQKKFAKKRRFKPVKAKTGQSGNGQLRKFRPKNKGSRKSTRSDPHRTATVAAAS